MNNLLSDTSKFGPLKVPPGKNLDFVINSQDKIKNILKCLHDKESLTDMLYKNISPVGCRPEILYGQAKYHKPVINSCPSFRPILDPINTQSYKLATFLVLILSSLAINEYTVKDSFVFAKEITNTDCNYVMASLDVEGLFTNIPLEETIKNCVHDLFFDKSKIDNLTKQDVYDLLSAAAKQSFFIFDNSLYPQIDGAAMGSPLGPTLANAFLCHYEEEWLDSSPIEFKPKLYKRYVDDIFVIFRFRDHVKTFVDYMNAKHPNIRFTFEIEDQNSFSFLAIKIIRNTEKKGFETSVYRRSTFSGTFTNFKSYIPMTYKTGLSFAVILLFFNMIFP